MKRYIPLSLAMTLLLTASMTACGEDSKTQIGDTVPSVTESKTEAITEVVVPLPEIDYGGANFKILTAAEQWQHFYKAEQTGDAVDDAVYARNMAVEERYNVTLDNIVCDGYSAGMETVRAALTGSVMGGDAEYDLMVGGIAYITPYILDNLFTDLYTLDECKLDQPWWFQHINNEIDICGRLYLGSGYYGMLSMSCAVVTFFNKEVAEENQIEDLYSTVIDGTWTYDKMTTLGKSVSMDLDGDGAFKGGDRYGILSSDDYLQHLICSMDHFYIEHAEDGSITLREPTERLIQIVDRLLATLKDPSYGNLSRVPSSFVTVDEKYEALLNMFANNQGLFLVHRLEFALKETLRNMEHFGILPPPKYDELQQDYITTVINDVAAIPGVVSDLSMSAVLLEALQYYTYDIVRPQYYEIALKRKATRDEQSEKMLDIIFSHTACDFTYMHLLTIGSELYFVYNKPNYASWAEKNYKKYRVKIEKIMETVKGFES